MLVIAGLLFEFTIVKMRGPNKSLKLKKKLKLKEELKILLKNSFGKINRQQSYHVLLTKRVLDPKARPAKLWEPSSQGTEINPQNCQIGVQQPCLLQTTNTNKQNLYSQSSLTHLT